jgi:hypothetical protein
MDILTFIKEIDFEIKDNLGFDVLWDSMNGKRYSNVTISLLKWFGYEGKEFVMKQVFARLLESNEIEYREIGFEDPLIKQFPEIQEEIEQMRPVDKPRKRWLIMDPDNFKEAIMSLTTKRSTEIRKYYLQLEKLVQLYGAYVLGLWPKT